MACAQALSTNISTCDRPDNALGVRLLLRTPFRLLLSRQKQPVGDPSISGPRARRAGLISCQVCMRPVPLARRGGRSDRGRGGERGPASSEGRRNRTWVIIQATLMGAGNRPSRARHARAARDEARSAAASAMPALSCPALTTTPPATPTAAAAAAGFAQCAPPADARGVGINSSGGVSVFRRGWRQGTVGVATAPHNASTAATALAAIRATAAAHIAASAICLPAVATGAAAICAVFAAKCRSSVQCAPKRGWLEEQRRRANLSGQPGGRKPFPFWCPFPLW
jgi:hypothetical protein